MLRPAANGQRVTIKLIEFAENGGKLKTRILDGRSRWKACEIAKVEPLTESVETDDPVAYVISHNVRRRNLTAAQRAMAAAESWPLVGGRPKRGGSGQRTAPSIEQMAKRWDIGTTALKQATALVEEAPAMAAAAARVGTHS